MKRVMVQSNFTGMTTKQYDQYWDDLRKLGHEHPKGLIHHVGAQQGNNLTVVDIWESEAAFNEFGKIATPILKKIGIPSSTPLITNIHYEQSNVRAEVHS